MTWMQGCWQACPAGGTPGPVRPSGRCVPDPASPIRRGRPAAGTPRPVSDAPRRRGRGCGDGVVRIRRAPPPATRYRAPRGARRPRQRRCRRARGRQDVHARVIRLLVGRVVRSMLPRSVAGSSWRGRLGGKTQVGRRGPGHGGAASVGAGSRATNAARSRVPPTPRVRHRTWPLTPDAPAPQQRTDRQSRRLREAPRSPPRPAASLGFRWAQDHQARDRRSPDSDRNVISRPPVPIEASVATAASGRPRGPTRSPVRTSSRSGRRRPPRERRR